MVMLWVRRGSKATMSSWDFNTPVNQRVQESKHVDRDVEQGKQVSSVGVRCIVWGRQVGDELGFQAMLATALRIFFNLVREKEMHRRPQLYQELAAFQAEHTR